ncbi:hypothetical protein L4174_008880 [Photobacterium sp. CCB-ST2H9]|uniref:hypothetical protein n=1 Tax=Photobacterium sp. CCB-ST2H9 TaxID=2912855 RepID=UPI002005F1F2|nr:hypothetical protein [Photobacterium sp. CCB-ST2H9]UTM55970.1 hypothetical protein L4174_008880 [Photobacterium sp. CCB-ST2H9]
MQQIIDFLENGDYDWHLDNNLYDDFIHVAKSFGYKFKTHKTESEVKEFLKEKLRQCLSGKEVSSSQYTNIEDHICFKHYSSKTGEFKSPFLFLSYVRYQINVLDSYNNSIESWLLARRYLEALYSIDSNYDPVNIQIFQEQKIISRSINYLRSKRYNVVINNGCAFLDHKSEVDLLSAIDYRLSKLGEQSLFFIMMMLSKRYDSKSRRYFLRSEPGLVELSKIDIPWGYLFNVCLNKLYEIDKPRRNFNKNAKVFEEVTDLIKHYFCIQRIQPFNKFSDINHRYDTILPAIQKNILYDQHFSIDQISNNHALKMVEGMFKSKLLESENINVDIYVDIMKWIFSRPGEKPYKFTVHDIYVDLLKYGFDDLKNALDILSHNYLHINRGYLNPSDIEKRNYYERPFINRGKYYIYINSNFCNYGFYYSLFDVFSKRGVDGNVLGKVAEDFVESQFMKNGITFHSNKNYSIPKEIARELNIKSQGRECDYIIETAESIVFIELKRKTLTSNARAGDALTSMVDISQSLFHALSQTGCHEYTLRRNEKIVFNDGTEILLNNRRIERVALTLFGFFGIQDGLFVHQILGSLINSELNSDDESKNKKVNKVLLELRNQYQTKIFQEEYAKEMNPFFNCRFFSVPQFIEILSFSSNNEGFLSELNRTRHISTGCKDWFKDYHYIRWLQVDRKGN